MFNRTLERRKRLLARLINASVPFLNRVRRPAAWPYSLDELRQFPEGSLGAATAAFLDERCYTFLPQYEKHDVIHTLLDYGTTTTGELRLQAFMWGNRSASIAGRVLLVLGLIVLPELWPQLKQDKQRGERAARLADHNLAVFLHEQLVVVRGYFNLPSPLR